MSLIKTAKIYALVDPITKDIRYIGQTCQDLKVRLNQHWRDRNQQKEKNQHKANWINKLYNQHGLRPEIQLIENLGLYEEITDDFLNERERFWIEHFCNLKCDLTNTSGKMYFRNVKVRKITNNKKIFAYNRSFEEIEFPSAREASRKLGINYKRICKICYGAGTNLDYFFSFKKLSKKELESSFISKKIRKKIKATCMKTGKEMIFDSQMEASKYFNCNFRNINQVLKNIRKSCVGHFFSYI